MKLYLATKWDRPEFEGGHEEPFGIFSSLELAKQVSEDHLKKDCKPEDIKLNQYSDACDFVVKRKYDHVGITIVEMELDKIKVEEHD